MSFDPQRILYLICAIPALVAGLTFHEFAHAWAADKLGDPTPRSQGRLTLDPLVHIDPFGALFFVISSLAGHGLGWAKPVMTNPRNLKHPRRDSLLIAIAGPISNLLQLPIWFLMVFCIGFLSAKFGAASSTATGTVSVMGLATDAFVAGITVNVGLAVFNMIPIPPLDGHWVLQSLGGRPVEELFDAIRPYSFIMLFIIIQFTPLVRLAVGPAEDLAYRWADQTYFAGMMFALR